MVVAASTYSGRTCMKVVALLPALILQRSSAAYVQNLSESRGKHLRRNLEQYRQLLEFDG